MSCDAVAFSAMLWLAAASPADKANLQMAEISAPAPPPSVAGEPLFADIIRRAGALRTQVDGFKGLTGPLPNFAQFQADVAKLSDLDMQGHLVLKERGVTDDLKCILRGISQDLPVRLKDVANAADPKARDQALKEMSYLLRDNVEVITSPPQPAA
ncbi:hypothetical protein QO010_004312 [Caulobacter ginsengisoli]|uniref:Uncharacterized protein n=1 Tax=Caulobacter ginsengisoli TaxID=400775 RepID=A0ABU0IZX2_9CAUL|nr:hypothetical protein [Caulobacter ginsengisoli]MDQ0466517.1 hypothetical protein [Caulobacter ginsengisoli]